MVKEYIRHNDYDREIALDENTVLKYYSRKKMKAKYPNHGYVVLGAVGDGRRHKKDEFIIHEEHYPYFTLEYQKLTYGIDGYMDCGNDEYIAVLKNRFIRNVVLVCILLAMLCTLVFGGGMLLSDKGGGIDPNATDYEPKITLPETADPNRIAIPGFDQINMLADTDEMYAALWNPETNPCYFKFTITMESDGEVLYQSGLIPPGKAITTVKINQKLKEGSYPVLIKMETFSLEDGETPMNSGTSKTVINAVKK